MTVTQAATPATTAKRKSSAEDRGSDVRQPEQDAMAQPGRRLRAHDVPHCAVDCVVEFVAAHCAVPPSLNPALRTLTRRIRRASDTRHLIVPTGAPSIAAICS